MMGVNIPDMIGIVKEHGLIPVPVDYDIPSMSPLSFDAIKEAITDKVSNNNSNSLFYRLKFCFLLIYSE